MQTAASDGRASVNMTLPIQAPDIGVPSPTEEAKSIFYYIKDYLESDESNAEATAAKTIASTVKPNEAEDINDIRDSIGLLWITILHVARQTPVSHPWQDKLVKLVAAIKGMPVPDNSNPALVNFEQVWGAQTWARLPLFGMQVRESWNNGPWTRWPENLPPPLPAWTSYPQHEWADLNAFVARLTAASVSNFDTLASWILRHTLEEERYAQEINENLPAAASWIMQAGLMLYSNAAREDTAPPEVYQSQQVVYLRKFTKRFCEERWAYWKERFAIFCEDTSLGSEARSSAKDAVKHMEKIKENWPEPSINTSYNTHPHSGLMLGVGGRAADS